MCIRDDKTGDNESELQTKGLILNFKSFIRLFNPVPFRVRIQQFEHDFKVKNILRKLILNGYISKFPFK